MSQAAGQTHPSTPGPAPAPDPSTAFVPEQLLGLILAGGQARRMQSLASGRTETFAGRSVTESDPLATHYPNNRPDRVTTTPASSRGTVTATDEAKRLPNGLGGLGSSGGSDSFEDSGQPAIDKGLLPLAGRPLVEWALRFLQPQVGQVLISANQNISTYATYAPVCPDAAEYGGDAGPLAGIASALALYEKAQWLLVVPVDVPILPAELLAKLSEAVQKQKNIAAYAATPQRDHPLCLLLHRSALPDLQNYLHAGGRKVSGWLKPAGAQRVLFTDNPDLFFNINTPDDLHRAEQMLDETVGKA